MSTNTDFHMFAHNLKHLRKAHLLISQAELGKLVGVSAQTISQYECGNCEPDIETLIRLSRALHTSIDKLVGV